MIVMMATLEFPCFNLCGDLTLSVMTMSLVGDHTAGPAWPHRRSLGPWSHLGNRLGLSIRSRLRTECHLLPALVSDTNLCVCFVSSFVSTVPSPLPPSLLNHFPRSSPRTRPAASGTSSAGIPNERPWCVSGSPGSWPLGGVTKTAGVSREKACWTRG